MAIVQISDFKDNPTYNIALTRRAQKQLPALIDQIEKDDLQELLGCELYDLFIADLTVATPQVPQAQIYLDIFNPFCKDDSIYCGERSFGMKDMLMGFIYMAWQSYAFTQDTAGGMVSIDNENSLLSTPDAAGLYIKQNRAVESYTAIQRYICTNMSVYPTFEGMRKNYSGII